jgi:hypothetical protein
LRLARRLLGAEAAARKLNFPAGDYAADAAAAAPAAAPALTSAAPPAPLPPVPESDEDAADVACDASDSGSDSEDEAAALAALAAAMRRHLGAPPTASAAAAASRWAPTGRLPAPLTLRDAAPPLAPSDPAADDATALLLPPRDAAARAAKAAARRGASNDAGPAWFGLGAPQMTPELKRDLRLLKLRGAFDPKRFYKSSDSSKLPTHFAIGTVVETAADFYAARLHKSERKRTLAEEIMADDGVSAFRKRRTAALDAAPGRGKGRKQSGTAKKGARHVKRRGRV